jgi:hypothetical protein
MCEWAPKGPAFPLCQHFARAIKHKEGKQHATGCEQELLLRSLNARAGDEKDTPQWQLNVRYCRERGAYLRITDRASVGRW